MDECQDGMHYFAHQRYKSKNLIKRPDQMEPAEVDVETQTGTEFPKFIAEGKYQLAGLGLRKKTILGLKSIIIYAFGVYADVADLNVKLNGVNSRDIKELLDDVACNVEVNVRLVIIYSSLKIAAVRNAFDDSIGGRMRKFYNEEDKELLHSFTGLFKDEIKLSKGTIIDIARLPGDVLRTTINGEEVGSVASKDLCRCVFDLYIGEEPFDKAGRDKIGEGLVSMIMPITN